MCKPQTFRGSKGGEVASWQLYQTASHACYAKSVRQISSQLASFKRGKNQLLHYLLDAKML